MNEQPTFRVRRLSKKHRAAFVTLLDRLAVQEPSPT